jgi:hypothetical protein
MLDHHVTQGTDQNPVYVVDNVKKAYTVKVIITFSNDSKMSLKITNMDMDMDL